jgi:tetratricopeptide (TPR) repeat protein
MTASTATDAPLAGRRVLFAGRLAGMGRREAQQVVRCQGGTPVERLDAGVDLVVLGEDRLPQDAPAAEAEMVEAARRQAAERGAPDIITETELWQRLGFVESDDAVRRLYTPAMLAGLLAVPVATVRRWHRRGLIRPVREVHKLPYFDFQEVTTARRLAELLAAGLSPQAIERKLAALARALPGVARPLAQLPVLVEGRDLLLRRGEGLIDEAGQWRLDFDAAESPAAAAGEVSAAPGTLPLASRAAPPAGADPDELLAWATALEDEGRLAEAAEMHRAALAAGGPRAEVCFLLAETLYRLGDLPAARERYYMAIELDEGYVEARANLGCLLAELGEAELAVAAFEGALVRHDEYADVHYHLARTLDDLGRAAEAEQHWQRFLRLSPEGPWADEARGRLEAAT